MLSSQVCVGNHPAKINACRIPEVFFFGFWKITLFLCKTGVYSQVPCGVYLYIFPSPNNIFTDSSFSDFFRS